MTLPAWYGKALSVVMVVSGIAVTALTPYYGGQHWFDAVIAALAALGVHGTLYTPSAASSSTVSPPTPTPMPSLPSASESAPLS